MKHITRFKQITLSFFTFLFITSCTLVTDAQQVNAQQASTSQVTEGEAGSIFFPAFGGLSEKIETEIQAFHLDSLLTEDHIKMPWGIAFLPDGHTLITERDGTLRLLRNGQLDSEPVAGVPEVYVRGQGGLLDVEAHPNYASNGWIYLSYSVPGEGGGHTAVMRAKLDASKTPAKLTDQEEIFHGGPYTRARVHFGSRLQFDRDGYLFFSIGDRGEMNNAQDITHYSGNVFRIHDDGSIPEDNPFTNEPEAKHEIYSYGHRNPQGMAIHPVTGRIWTHEHGPRGGDEINVINKGVNYGWPVITYGIDYDGSIISYETEKEGMAQPVHYWDPSIAPSGMEFIDGQRYPVRYPQWENQMIVGALKFQMLVRVELDGESYVKEERFLEGVGRIREVEQGPDGYLYVLSEGPSALYRLIPADR